MGAVDVKDGGLGRHHRVRTKILNTHDRESGHQLITRNDGTGKCKALIAVNDTAEIDPTVGIREKLREGVLLYDDSKGDGSHEIAVSRCISSHEIVMEWRGCRHGARELAHLLAPHLVRLCGREDSTDKFRVYSHPAILGVGDQEPLSDPFTLHANMAIRNFPSEYG